MGRGDIRTRESTHLLAVPEEGFAGGKVRGGRVQDGDGEDAPRRGDQGDLAEGGVECGEELLGELFCFVSGQNKHFLGEGGGMHHGSLNGVIER